MRICMLIDAWFPVHGGGQVHVLELSKRLVSDYGFEVDIFTRKLRVASCELRVRNQHLGIRKQGLFPSEEMLKFGYKVGLRVFRLRPMSRFENFFARMWWMFWVVIRVFLEHRKKNYNLIHAHAFSSGIPGKILSKILRIPVIYTVHGTSMGLGKKGFLAFIERFLLTKIRYTQEISVSHNFLQFPNVNKNIAVIPNGVNIIKIKSQKSKVKSIKKNFIALFVGRFDKIKGVDILIKAIQMLVQKDADLLRKRPFQLNLVGFGFEEDNLKKLVKKLKLDKIVFFKGKKTGKNLVLEYLSANLFVLPSLSEGHPLTLLEAWATKIPVLATDVGDNALYFKDGINGFLVKPNSAFALSEGIKKAILRKDLEKFGVNGYKLVARTFSWDKMVEKVIKIYRKLSC